MPTPTPPPPAVVQQSNHHRDHQTDSNPPKIKTPNSSSVLSEDHQQQLKLQNKALLNIAEVLRDINKPDLTIPLDLSTSTRRLSSARPIRDRSMSFSSALSAAGDPDGSGLDMMLLLEGKENMSGTGSDSRATPEQIVCAPSLPGSPPLTPSPKRRSSNSPRVSNLSPTSQHAAIIRAMPPELSIHFPASADYKLRLDGLKRQPLVTPPPPPLLKLPSPTPVVAVTAAAQVSPASSAPPMQPQIIVKHGMSKCKECNIVFCKYENYVAHKKHYCSARNLDDPEGANVKVSPPISPHQPPSPSLGAQAVANSRATGPANVVLPYQQLICAACGTKFTSLDNLGAHQMYYCAKRAELQVAVSYE